MLYLKWSISAPLPSMQNEQKNNSFYLAVWAELPARYYTRLHYRTIQSLELWKRCSMLQLKILQFYASEKSNTVKRKGSAKRQK